MLDCRGDRGHVAADDCQPARHGFEHDVGEAVAVAVGIDHAGHSDDVGPVIHRRQFGVGSRAEKFDAVGFPGGECRSL